MMVPGSDRETFEKIRGMVDEWPHDFKLGVLAYLIETLGIEVEVERGD